MIANLKTRIASWLLETRGGEQEISWEALAGLLGADPNGPVISARAAENLSTVLACVSAISSAIGSLPAYVYREVEKGRQPTPQHPLQALIDNGPNQHQTWPEFIEWLTASALLRGNGLAEIVSDHRGQITGFEPIPWDWVSVQLLNNGRLAFDVTPITAQYGGTGRSRRLLQHEVIHLRDRTDDGLIGRSRLQRAAGVVTNASTLQRFAQNIYANGGRPAGTLNHPSKLSKTAMDNIRESWNRSYSGPANAGKVAVLFEGMSFTPLAPTPEDAELLASRKFSTEELARLYGCPPPIVGDYSNNTFTNANTAGRWFAQFTLNQWITKLEALFKQLLGPGYSIELDMSSFLRGDPEQRWAAHAIAVKNNILTVDEVREVEGYGPRGNID